MRSCMNHRATCPSPGGTSERADRSCAEMHPDGLGRIYRGASGKRGIPTARSVLGLASCQCGAFAVRYGQRILCLQTQGGDGSASTRWLQGTAVRYLFPELSKHSHVWTPRIGASFGKTGRFFVSAAQLGSPPPELTKALIVCIPDWVDKRYVRPSTTFLSQLMGNQELARRRDIQSGLWVSGHWAGLTPRNVLDARLAGGGFVLARRISHDRAGQ